MPRAPVRRRRFRAPPAIATAHLRCILPSRFFGDASSVDLIKVHLQSGKVTFLIYDDFDIRGTPFLVERIKVDLPRLRVDFFDYGDAHQPQPLDGDAASYFFRN